MTSTMTAVSMGIPMRAGPRARLVAPGARDTAPPAPATITQLPATVNLVIYQGDDFYLDLTVTDASGGAADLTGFTATAEVRSAPGATTGPPMSTFTCTIAANIIHLHLPASEAANLNNPASWDCQIEATDVITLVAGKVTVTLQVTPG